MRLGAGGEGEQFGHGLRQQVSERREAFGVLRHYAGRLSARDGRL